MKKSIEFLVLLVIVAAAPGWAQWSTVGSAGTVDESDGRDVILAAGRVSPKANKDIIIRYNVVNTTLSGGNLVQGFFRFKDEGDDTQVLCNLNEYDLETGGTTRILSFNSNDFPPDADLQLQSTELVAGSFDFAMNAYYVSCKLTEGSSGANASLGAIQLVANFFG